MYIIDEIIFILYICYIFVTIAEAILAYYLLSENNHPAKKQTNKQNIFYSLNDLRHYTHRISLD